MKAARTTGLFCRMDAFEYALCLRLNRSCSHRSVRNVFAIVSRLGDGVFWYALVLLLPIMYGADGVPSAVRMTMTGAAGYIIYKLLKSRLVRERPYVALVGVVAGTHALDRYSFPSGHTLHATSFTILAVAQDAALAWVCGPFAIMVAVSRVILGLHYPTDVAAGALIGAALAGVAMLVVPLP